MTRRLRVVHVSGCLEMGGQEKLLVEFAKHADRDRFELRFVSLTGRGILADELEAHGWPVDALGVAPGLHLGLPVRLAKLLRSWRADVVHTHNDRPLIYGASAARLARVGCVVHTKHGRSTGNSRRQNLLTAWTARLVDHFVCVSEDCTRLAREQGVPTNRLSTMHNGIDTHRFEFGRACADGPALLVARLCADKDVATLLRATSIVVQALPDFRLWIAGDGPDMADLRDLARQLNLVAHVRFLGMVDDVPRLYRQARMFVLSSISEGVPLTLLEAMATGLPSVATRVGGVPEVVTDGVDGLLVPPRDPARLAAAMLRVGRDDELTQHLGSAARRRVETHFDVRRMVQRYEQWYAVKNPSANPRPIHEVQGCASHT